MKLDGKVAIVTASAGAGIGQGTIRVLAIEGARVVVSDAHERRTGEVAEVLKSEGYQAIGIPCDVTNREQVEDMVRRTLEEWGRIDILVNNAGINRPGPVNEMSDEDWELVIDTNLKGTFYCTRAVLPTMINQNYGRIVNISSIAGWATASRDEAAYCAAKAGIMAFTRCVALETAKYDITVNAIAPGFIKTGMTGALTEQQQSALLSRIPFARLGEPEDVARTALFLASHLSDYITGQVLVVDGGMVM